MKFTGNDEMVLIGFSKLATVYFLSGFVVTVAPDSKHNLLTLMPYKLLYIAASVGVIGLLFFTLNMEGYKEMFLFSCGALGVSVLASAALVATNPDNMAIPKQPLFIDIPLFLISGYFVYYTSIH